MQKTLFRNPASLDDKLLMHQCDLPRGATKTQKPELEPKAKGLPETDLCNVRASNSLQRANLVRLSLAKAN
jgi:hypothetical protein